MYSYRPLKSINQNLWEPCSAPTTANKDKWGKFWLEDPSVFIYAVGRRLSQSWNIASPSRHNIYFGPGFTRPVWHSTAHVGVCVANFRRVGKGQGWTGQLHILKKVTEFKGSHPHAPFPNVNFNIILHDHVVAPVPAVAHQLLVCISTSCCNLRLDVPRPAHHSSSLNQRCANSGCSLCNFLSLCSSQHKHPALRSWPTDRLPQPAHLSEPPTAQLVKFSHGLPKVHHDVAFEVFAAVSTKMATFWAGAPYSLTDVTPRKTAISTSVRHDVHTSQPSYAFGPSTPTAIPRDIL